MNKLLFFAALLTAGMFFTSCGDDDGLDIDSEAPVVTFNTPATGTSYAVGDTIEFSVTATDNEMLTLMTLSSNLGLNQTFTTFDSETTHTQEFNVAIIAGTPAGDYSVSMTATDATANTGESSIDLTIQ